MRQVVVSVYDKGAQVFGRPVFVRTEAEALRSFETQVRDANTDGSNPLFTHPQDFALYQLGWFDDESGKFENRDVPARLVEGSAVGPGAISGELFSRGGQDESSTSSWKQPSSVG